MVWTYFFIFYCYEVVQDAAGIGTLWDLMYYKKMKGEINFVPFSSVGATTYILNIIMFMPLGFLLPLIWSNFRNIKKVVALGFAFSLCIEICQLFCSRITDIDDLTMNTLGTIVGFFIWVLFHKIFKNSGEKSIMICPVEPITYMVIGTIGVFFLYNKFYMF